MEMTEGLNKRGCFLFFVCCCCLFCFAVVVVVVVVAAVVVVVYVLGGVGWGWDNYNYTSHIWKDFMKSISL